jgi:chromosome segregation ATPase
MRQNEGWIQRVFRHGELEAKVRRANLELAEKERRVIDLERQVEMLGSEAAEKTRKANELERQLLELRSGESVLSGADEHEQRSTATQTRDTDERAAVQANLAQMATRLAEVTAKLSEAERESKSGAEREAELGKSLAIHDRRAEQLASELEKLEQQVEANGHVSQLEKKRWEAELAARDEALDAKTDAISAAEWKIATLESELSQLKQELERSRATERDHGERLAEARREQAQAVTFADRRKILLAQTRETLVEILRLSAHALERTLGSAGHLAIELAAARCPPKGSKESETGHEISEAVLELRNRLALIGVAEDFVARLEGVGYFGRFRVSMIIPPSEATGLARWVAAYAIEILNGASPVPMRLETLEGGPAEYQFTAAPRHTPALGSSPRASVSHAHDAKAPDSAQRGTDARYD